MKNYKVHFSYYSEEHGHFEENILQVEAENQFEARQKAWALSENNDNFAFASNLKICGITWSAPPLDLQDYFNSQSAYAKQMLKYTENIEIPNAKIKKNEQNLTYHNQRIYEFVGCLHAVNDIAEDFGKAHGLIPPSIFEELHYAKGFVDLLSSQGNHDHAYEMLKTIENAEKWKSDGTHKIATLFRDKGIYLDGKDYYLAEHFHKDGIVPFQKNAGDSDYNYISRWQNITKYNELDRMPFFGPKSIIRGSYKMDYEYKILVLDKELIDKSYHSPINALWFANQGGNAQYEEGKNSPLKAENIVTGEVVEWKRSDFIGVLKPEIVENIDFQAIKAEYKKTQAVEVENVQEVDTDNGFEDETDELEQ